MSRYLPPSRRGLNSARGHHGLAPGGLHSLLVCSLILLILASCSPVANPPAGEANNERPAPTQTAVVAELRGTLTAKAPTATSTPPPVPTDTPPPPTLTPSPQPTPTLLEPEILPMLAFVRISEDQSANVIIRDLSSGQERVLTHFGEPLGIFDLHWSGDGSTLLLISAHNYLASRGNERNVFTVRSDGTGLRMVTGDPMPPNEAIGPFVTVTGTVTGTRGACYVSAQGAASPTTTDADGAFSLAGVPESAGWLRAVCAPESPPNTGGETDATLTMQAISAYQGSLSFTDGVSMPLTVTLTVSPGGSGWRQASLAPDGNRLSGVRYTWTVDEDGAPDYQAEGVIYDLESRSETSIEIPESAQIEGLTWSPCGERIAGTYRLAQGTVIAIWNSQGQPLETILEIPDTDSIMMTARQVRWSPDGTRLAYALQQHYWWDDPAYKTEIWVVSLADRESHVVTSLRWGEHATHPSWTADGGIIYYEFARGAKDEATPPIENYSLRAMSADGTGRPTPLLEGERAILPAAHPLCPIGSPKPEDVLSVTDP